MMPRDKQPKVALVWSQFIAYHIDRCVALANRLEGRAEVLAIEVAQTSHDYSAFPPSGDTGKAQKRTLFPGRSFESVPRWRRFCAVFSSVIGCRTVCLGVPYSQLEFVLLAWVLRLLGKRVVLMCDSKFDDTPRAFGFEFAKGLGLSCYSAVMVAGARGADYFHFLGFRRRPVLPGCDTVSVDRIRAEAASQSLAEPDFGEREFVYVGRFVAKKNLSHLIAAYAHYRQLAGDAARRLVLVGSGPLEDQLRDEAADQVPEGCVIFAGFRSGPALYGLLASSLGLTLVSSSEQWGLVVNEAVALGLPVIVSEAPGARDVLVRGGINGFVVENGSTEGLALAMQRLGGDSAAWQRMRQAAHERAWLGDAERFADAVELLLDPVAQPTAMRNAAYLAAFEEFRGRRD